MIQVHITLSKPQHKFLKQLGDLSMTEHVRRAVDRYIEEKVKEQQILLSSSSPQSKKHGNN